MADADEKPMVSIDPRYLLTGDVVERPPDDTIEAILDWLAGPAQQIPSLSGAFDEFALRMLAAGFPLLRTTLHTRTLHPQSLGASFVWLRTTGQTVQTLVAHEVEELPGHENNPVWKVGLGGETLRRRVDVADDELDFPILHDLKAEGATDYFALPVKSALGTNYTVTYATDRIASNILSAYLDSKTGPKVLAGQIRRGTGEEITTVLWSSDLRGVLSSVAAIITSRMARDASPFY